jgi:CheY-like chemotaxis protein
MQKKILVADDKEYVVKLLESKLSSYGYRIIACKDGRDALEKAKTHIPDLILMDIVMPGMDGTSAADEIRNTPETAHIPIIFLTALVEKSEEEETRHMIGGNYFIAKPFEIRELLALIREILKED